MPALNSALAQRNDFKQATALSLSQLNSKPNQIVKVIPLRGCSQIGTLVDYTEAANFPIVAGIASRSSLASCAKENAPTAITRSRTATSR